MTKRLIIHLPSHPLLMFAFLIIALTPLIWLYLVPKALALALQPLGVSLVTGYFMAVVMVMLSMIMSVVNIAIIEVPKRIALPDFDYILVFGIPYPIPKIRYVSSKTIIALNVGGALIPLILSSIMMGLMIFAWRGYLALIAVIVVMLVVALIAYAFSKIVPGVGIVVPALIPPLTAALASIVLSNLMGIAIYAPAIAYVGAVTGTLIGADIVNLIKHFDEIQSPLVSIGGAGTFDGIYLSGIMALFLALLFT